MGRTPDRRVIVSTNPSAAALARAFAAYREGRLGEAEGLYLEVLSRQPRSFEALHLLGVIAAQTGRAEQAIEYLQQALIVRPDHVQALANLGTASMQLQRAEEALRCYDRALALDPGFAGALANRGNLLQQLGRHREAAEAFGRLRELAPASDFTAGNLFQSRRQLGDWRDFDGQTTALRAALGAGRRVDRPFSFLSVSDVAAEQLECARLYADFLCPARHPPLWRGTPYRHERIRVAYVSADFRDHVVAHFMAAIYERHDPLRFDTLGISLAPIDSSEVVGRVRRALGDFVEVSRIGDAEVAGLMISREIDIAVDLTGYTQGCRPGIFARRPAPVQVNLLGFPATLGAPWMDYLIADGFVVPVETEAHYSERIARLPDTFQANDDRRAHLVEVPTPSRSAAGLPDGGIVLCSFNNSYKLNPRCFDAWMQVLRELPESVLWLLGGDPTLEANLRREALARDVAAERLIFAQRLPYAEHLARLRLADLFLDTWPFNAGATASDALWAAVPVLTWAGEAFAARMAGSLLNAAGLPDLICASTMEYTERAIALGRDPAQLHGLKQRLASDRTRGALFDTVRYCRHLEAAYVRMWERSERGVSPASFSIPQLE